MDGMHFLLYAPVFCAILGSIGGMIAVLVDACSSSKFGSGNKALRKSNNSLSYHSYGEPSSFYDDHYPDYISKISMETEMKAHDARMEQMMQEQNKILIDNELHRIYDSTRTSLADQLDPRLTNIFKNPWEGIL